MRQYIIIISLLLLPLSILAQKDITNINRGNKLYRDSAFVKSEVEYRKALERNQKQYAAKYNLGNALFQQEKYPEAVEQYEGAASLTDDKMKLAAAYHNMGNSLLKGDKIEESIEAYKQSLLNNPKDDETRYNLAFAKHMLKQQQQQQQQQQDKKDEKKEEKKDEQQQNQENQEQQQDKQQEQQQQQQQQQMSKETAEQLLKALEQDEKDVQEKVQQQKQAKTKRYKVEKDW